MTLEEFLEKVESLGGSGTKSRVYIDAGTRYVEEFEITLDKDGDVILGLL